MEGPTGKKMQGFGSSPSQPTSKLKDVALELQRMSDVCIDFMTRVSPLTN